jgi:hypothetical protein
MPLDQRGFEIPAETKPHDVFSLEAWRDWIVAAGRSGETGVLNSVHAALRLAKE